MLNNDDLDMLAEDRHREAARDELRSGLPAEPRQITIHWTKVSEQDFSHTFDYDDIPQEIRDYIDDVDEESAIEGRGLLTLEVPDHDDVLARFESGEGHVEQSRSVFGIQEGQPFVSPIPAHEILRLSEDEAALRGAKR